MRTRLVPLANCCHDRRCICCCVGLLCRRRDVQLQQAPTYPGLWGASPAEPLPASRAWQRPAGEQGGHGADDQGQVSGHMARRCVCRSQSQHCCALLVVTAPGPSMNCCRAQLPRAFPGQHGKTGSKVWSTARTSSPSKPIPFLQPFAA